MRLISQTCTAIGFCLALSLTARDAAAAPPTIDTTARTAIAMDFATGAVLLDKGADQRIPPASMSKIMTAYVVFDDLKKGQATLEDVFRYLTHAASAGPSVARIIESLNS